MAKKGNRIQVILECTEHKNSGVAGTSRYVTTKNKKNTPDRMELKKYNPILRKYYITGPNNFSYLVENKKFKRLKVLKSNSLVASKIAGLLDIVFQDSGEKSR